MKTMRSIAGLVGGLCLLAGSVQAADWYVATNGNDSADGTNWPTAKLTIQAGVDAASDGETVFVSNGVYATASGRAGAGAWLNRVAIDKAITVRSANGPDETFIVGGGMRCVYVTNGAVLSGFTLTNGVTQNGFCGDMETDTVDHYGGGVLSGDSGVVTNCMLTGNWACYAGGGANGGTLNNCILTNNFCEMFGGGAADSILNFCILTANGTHNNGGASWRGELNDCELIGNQASAGGGAYAGTLNHCVLENNYAGSQGGGALQCTLTSCLLVDNTAGLDGGGANLSILKNCTVVSNSALELYARGGGGTYKCTVNNSIVMDNTSGSSDPNWWGGTYNYTCTTPLHDGTGNITNDPQFVDAVAGDYRLQTNSPCINMGDNDLVQGDTDLDGNPRIAFGSTFGRVDMGAYEFIPLMRYVAKNGSDAAAGTNWATAKLTIQAAVDEADNSDMVIVSNGVYATGGRTVGESVLTNRVAIDLPISVRSVNGPELTIIQGAKDPGGTHGRGDAAVRCAYVTDGAVLSGFMLTNGATQVTGFLPITNNTPYAKATHGDAQGGGAKCGSSAVLNRCIIVGNSAEMGGGVSYGNHYNCAVIGNDSSSWGGGAYECMLYNCTVVSNSAGSGGDISGCGGANSIADINLDDVKFVDPASGDFRLLPISPYIDAGGNGVVYGDEDLDGNPRIAYGTVDVGAYEAQLAGPGTWFTAITNGLTNDLECATGDGIPNLLKYATGSSPRISDSLADLDGTSSSGVPVLNFNRNPNATDVEILIEGSDAMINGAIWRGLATNINGSWGGAANVSESASGEPVVVTVTDPIALESNRFLRLKVTRP